MKGFFEKALNAGKRLDGRLAAHRLLAGGLLALLLSGLLALANISAGPLHNLNDIGGWNNRLLFIAMTAAVHAALLFACACLHRSGFARLALRQLILTAGLYILLLGINQKTYAYVQTIQPLVRAMDAQGLAAAANWETILSAPAMTLLYLITRGPVYDMYLVKLLAVGSYLLLALLAAHAAQHVGLKNRTEALLALLMILPQGFMNAAASAQMEVFACALLAVSLALLFFADKPRPLAAIIFFGLAVSVSGAALYALPVYGFLLYNKKRGLKLRHLAAGLAMPFALCVPTIACGMDAGKALGSVLSANLSAPAYASGAPNLLSLLPRAVVEEMPQYAPILRHLPEIDAVTNAQPYYTQAHFEQAALGLSLAGLAAYMGFGALALHIGRQDRLRGALTLALSALLICPAATSGAWLFADVLCVYALLTAPKLRMPACMVLFATAGASCYPMTEEVLLPMIAAAALCLGALCLLLNVIPERLGEAEEHE